MTIEKTIGSRAEVWHGTAKHTSGGLTKNHLFKNKSGRIVSKKKHFTAKKDNRLVKSGYGTKKGKFGYVKIGTQKRSKKGGAPHGNSLSPAGIDGQSVTDYPHNSTDVQIAAGMAGGKRRKRGGSKGYGWLNHSSIENAHHLKENFKGGKRRKHGGTTKASALSPASAPLSRALNAV
jgi:hypothetical protein